MQHLAAASQAWVHASTVFTLSGRPTSFPVVTPVAGYCVQLEVLLLSSVLRRIGTFDSRDVKVAFQPESPPPESPRFRVLGFRITTTRITKARRAKDIPWSRPPAAAAPKLLVSSRSVAPAAGRRPRSPPPAPVGRRSHRDGAQAPARRDDGANGGHGA